MTEYHKIDSVYLRDPETNHQTFIDGAWSRPEFGYLADCHWAATEKVDGTNLRIYKTPDTGDVVRGRTDRADLPPKLLPRLVTIQTRLAVTELPDDTVLYGEGYGASIQKGGKYRPDVDFVLFDVNMGGNWQPRPTVEEVADLVGVAPVPVLGVAPLTTWVNGVRAGYWSDSELHPGAPAEGVVLRPVLELVDRVGRRIITKAKFRDFPDSMRQRRLDADHAV